MKLSWTWGGLAILAMVLAAAAVSTLRGKAGDGEALAAAPEPRGVYGIGTVEARVQSAIGFEVAGTLVDLTADQGDAIAKGQVLARLADGEQRAAVAQAEAALAQARARLERARAARDQKKSVDQRRQTLERKGTISTEAAEDARAGADIASADVAVAMADIEASRALLERERQRLAKYTLAAPYDGVVIRRDRELGAAVVAAVPIFTMVDPATVWVRAYVDEARAGRLAVGQPARVTLRSLPGRDFAGRVARIDIEADRVSEERIVHVAFDAIPQPFHLGEQAEVVVESGE
ncbi:efflux RND transporter periplasmic adaptor subunit [Magnetospirillum sp. UT-4]|uniref:efflux RND transporter periplasmic adaptor subunit n=1 Tax=Magnetospirillum sp. UT-4 TaxID=2681467 RepID=UPI00137C776B|nr:efflux RND transporter periplasmic adaptor subunit [Magnetospirillum sp. UT-4]CAA7626205.1 Secretion protein HlyD [Magnetospirillum sp. UT-4]